MPTHIVAVAAIVENDRGEVLLIHQARHGWGYPGGQVEAGENLIEALQREVREETGAEIEVHCLFCVASNTCTYPGYDGVKTIPTKVMMDFTARYLSGDIRPSEENDRTQWVPKGQALDRITHPMMRDRFQAYLEYSGSPRYLSYVTKPEYHLDVERQI